MRELIKKAYTDGVSVHADAKLFSTSLQPLLPISKSQPARLARLPYRAAQWLSLHPYEALCQVAHAA